MASPQEPEGFSLSSIFELAKNSFRLLKLMWKARRRLVVTRMLMAMTLAILPFAQILLLGVLINSLVLVAGKAADVTSLQDFLQRKPLGDNWALLNLGLLILGVVGVRLFMPFFLIYQRYNQWLASEYLSDELDINVLARRGHIDVAGHEDREKKALLTRVRDHGFRTIRFEDRQFAIMQSTIEVLLAVVIVGFANWWILIAIILGALPGLIAEVQYGRAVWRLQAAQVDERRRIGNMRSHLEGLHWLIELKLFQNVNRFVSMIAALFLKLRTAEEENERYYLKRRLRFLMFSQAVIAASLLWFVWEVINGNMPIGQLVMVFASIEAFRLALSTFFSNVGLQAQDSMFVTDTFRLLEQQPLIKVPEDGFKLDEKATPEIVFDKVSFKYPRSDKLVIDNFSLVIKPGERIALVGANGAGKTTLVKLLCRFYDPTSGSITVGGKDLRELDLQTWYGLLGVLSQNYANYQLPVKDGIALGRTAVPLDIERVKTAATESEAAEFIAALEKGYDEVVGPDNTSSTKLSQGEWQKLALARVFYRHARVLVLDEPTAAVDAEAEARIFERLRKADDDKTEVLISHRFSTVRNADRIVVMEDGAIKECGTHDELMKKQGAYAKLFEIQAKGYGS